MPTCEGGAHQEWNADLRPSAYSRCPDGFMPVTSFCSAVTTRSTALIGSLNRGTCARCHPCPQRRREAGRREHLCCSSVGVFAYAAPLSEGRSQLVASSTESLRSRQNAAIRQSQRRHFS